MSTVLIAPTEEFIKRERTSLAADASAGSSVELTFANGNGYAVNDYIVIGTEGSETAELCLVTVVSGNTITVATLLLSHKKGEGVVKYRYNKRKFYGSTTATGSYTELTANGSPVTIGVDDPQGSILEYTGGEGYTYFKATYYNSTTAEESNVVDAGAVLANESVRYTTLTAIRIQAGLLNNPYIADGRIERKRTQAENEINSVLFRLYTLPLSEVPPLISRICELLAAGYIDFEEYGPEGQGVKWLGEGRGLLNSIRDGKQALIKTDGTELARKTTTQGIQSYPDQVDNNNGPTRHFTMGQRF